MVRGHLKPKGSDSIEITAKPKKAKPNEPDPFDFFMKYLVSFIYTALVTVIYFMYLYKEDISLLMALIVPAVFFSPLLLALTDMELNMVKMNMVILSAFITGFIVAAFITNNNIWPIALVTWLGIGIPALFVLNVTYYVYKRKKA